MNRHYTNHELTCLHPNSPARRFAQAMVKTMARENTPALADYLNSGSQRSLEFLSGTQWLSLYPLVPSAVTISTWAAAAAPAMNGGGWVLKDRNGTQSVVRTREAVTRKLIELTAL